MKSPIPDFGGFRRSCPTCCQTRLSPGLARRMTHRTKQGKHWRLCPRPRCHRVSVNRTASSRRRPDFPTGPADMLPGSLPLRAPGASLPENGAQEARGLRWPLVLIGISDKGSPTFAISELTTKHSKGPLTHLVRTPTQSCSSLPDALRDTKHGLVS